MINHTALVCMPRQAFFLPHPSIQTPILNRFRQMLLTNILRSIKIGNRPRDFENARVAAGGEAEALGDELEEAVTGFVRLAMFADEARRHLGVAVDAAVAEALFLDGTAGFDASCGEVWGVHLAWSGNARLILDKGIIVKKCYRVWCLKTMGYELNGSYSLISVLRGRSGTTSPLFGTHQELSHC